MIRKEVPGMEHYATRSMMGIPLSGDLHNPIHEDTASAAGGGREKTREIRSGIFEAIFELTDGLPVTLSKVLPSIDSAHDRPLTSQDLPLMREVARLTIEHKNA